MKSLEALSQVDAGPETADEEDGLDRINPGQLNVGFGNKWAPDIP